jgi:isopenicillin-N epimerase
MIEPVKALTAIAKQYGCVVMIDGAHAPGVLDIDVEDIGADLYTGNCHKWLFAPKGCAFLWVSPSYRAAYTNSPQPVVISSTGRYDYTGRFAYTGTRDYTAFCTLPSSFTFINDTLGGMETMRSYCKGLLKEGCDLLVQEWKTGYLVSMFESMLCYTI